MRICCLHFMCFEEEKEDNNMDTDRDEYCLALLKQESEELDSDDSKLPESLDNGVGERDDLGEKSENLLGVNVDVNWNLVLGGEVSSPSSSRSVMGRENRSLDSQNKRPKIDSFSLDMGTNSEDGIHSFPPVHEVGYEGMPDSGVDGEDARNNNDNFIVGDSLDIRMYFTDDLLHMIFSFLDLIGLCTAAQVCRQWRDASSHEDFWHYLNFEDRPISAQQFEDMCLRYPNASAVNVYGTPDMYLSGMNAVSLLRNLEVLTLGNDPLEEPFFQALPDCQMLRSLTINNATLGTGPQEIPIYHDRLRDLHLVKCRVLRVSIRCPQLENLSLKRSSMPNAVLNCPLLRELDISSCHKLMDAAIRSAATSCPLLESLDMSNCSSVSNDTLQEIARSCGNLHVLDASYCQNISLERVMLPMLRVLKLHSCKGITSASMAAIAHSSMLEVLELDNCSSLISVSLDLPCLQNIRLVHCRKFVDLDLRSSVLTSITISNCPSLERISITSDALKKLVLQKQENLTMLALQCHCLQEVDLTECESLTDSICIVFSSGGGCPALRSLVLDSCKNLAAVSFYSTSLVSLSFSGCRAITSLVLSCPYLEYVSLDGCDRLERATFSPVDLRSLNLGICPKLSALHVQAPKMVSLELKACGVLSEAYIDCPLLRSLDASFCSQLKDECLSATTSSCPLIESLVLMSCSSVGPGGLSSLHHLQLLTYLDLSYTFLVNLQPVIDSCLHLKVLKLQACKYLSGASLEPLYKRNALPALCELDLSYGMIGQSAIEELLACCRQLTHVSLNGCVNMHDLDWGFQMEKTTVLRTFYGSYNSLLENVLPPQDQVERSLQNLNCVGCPNIKKVVIPPTARCIHLSSLNLSLSSNLKEVDISCCNLLLLNLSNCNSLGILKLDCPKLTSLFLQFSNVSEEAVEAAIKQCNVLETLDVRHCSKIPQLSIGRLRTVRPSLKRIFSSLSPP